MSFALARTLSSVGKETTKYTQFLNRVANLRVNGRGDKVVVTVTGDLRLEKVRLDASLAGKVTAIEAQFSDAMEDARRKLHDLKLYHWKDYFGDAQTLINSELEKEGGDNMGRFMQNAVNNFSTPDTDPVPPYVYDTAHERMVKFEDAVREMNLEPEQVYANIENLSSFLAEKGVSREEFEQRAMAGVYNETVRLPPFIVKQLQAHIDAVMAKEGEFDMANRKRMTMEDLSRLKEERFDTIFTVDGQKIDDDSLQSSLDHPDHYKMHLDPALRGLVDWKTDYQVLRRLLLDTSTDVKDMMDNLAPFSSIKTVDTSVVPDLSVPGMPPAIAMVNDYKELHSKMAEWNSKLTLAPGETPLPSLKEAVAAIQNLDANEISQALKQGRFDDVLALLDKPEVRGAIAYLENAGLNLAGSNIPLREMERTLNQHAARQGSQDRVDFSKRAAEEEAVIAECRAGFKQ